MVNPLEVGPAGELQSRSKKDGLEIDHIPSQKMLEATLLQLDAKMPRQQISNYLKKAPGIAIPANVHKDFGETYAGRNTQVKQTADAADLKAAVDSNFDAIKRGLLQKVTSRMISRRLASSYIDLIGTGVVLMAKLIFKYAENTAVNTLVFTLIDTGHN